MAYQARILAFAGSTRADSFNKKLVKLAVAGARAAGAEVTELDLRDFPMPLYDEDLEKTQGIPPHGRRLKDLFLNHDGLLISSPEYNSSYSGVLKNSIDWVSRPVPNEPHCFAGKVAGLMSASPGALGGLRGLVHVRAMLGNLRVLVLPEQVTVPIANEAFDENGNLKDASRQRSVVKLGARVAQVLAKLNG